MLEKVLRDRTTQEAVAKYHYTARIRHIGEKKLEKKLSESLFSKALGI